jgi:hypothetical protein
MFPVATGWLRRWPPQPVRYFTSSISPGRDVGVVVVVWSEILILVPHVKPGQRLRRVLPVVGFFLSGPQRCGKDPRRHHDGEGQWAQNVLVHGFALWCRGAAPAETTGAAWDVDAAFPPSVRH